MDTQYLHFFNHALRTILSKDMDSKGRRSVSVSRILTSDLVIKLNQLGYKVTIRYGKYQDGIYIKG